MCLLSCSFTICWARAMSRWPCSGQSMPQKRSTSLDWDLNRDLDSIPGPCLDWIPTSGIDCKFGLHVNRTLAPGRDDLRRVLGVSICRERGEAMGALRRALDPGSPRSGSRCERCARSQAAFGPQAGGVKNGGLPRRTRPSPSGTKTLVVGVKFRIRAGASITTRAMRAALQCIAFWSEVEFEFEFEFRFAEYVQCMGAEMRLVMSCHVMSCALHARRDASVPETRQDKSGLQEKTRLARHDNCNAQFTIEPSIPISTLAQSLSRNSRDSCQEHPSCRERDLGSLDAPRLISSPTVTTRSNSLRGESRKTMP